MKKICSVLSIIVCFLLVLAGCGDKVSQTGGDQFTFKDYPIEGNNELTYWVTLNANVSATSADMTATYFAQQLEKETGVKIKFIHPPQGQERDQLNILLTSKNIPDIIEYEWAFFPGGPSNAIQQEYIIDLANLIKTSSPNLSKYMEKNTELAKMMKTDDGKYFAYPFVRGDEKLQVFNGPIVRKDWLDELGFDIPETIDDWHTMLTAFKEKKNATAPLSYVSNLFVSNLNNGNFIGAYGIIRGFYVENGKVKFGAVQPAYKEFLNTFSQWYNEGLIDKNISNLDSGAIDVNILKGRSGATVGFAGGGIGSWMKNASEIPGFELAAVPYPVLNRGDRPKFGQWEPEMSTSGAAAITTSCKNPELAARFLDYGYSERGHALYNFGIEGESYNVVNGYPTYTDIILNNPNKLSIGQAMAQYTRASYFGPFVQDRAYIEQFYQLDSQKNALEVWANTDAKKNKMPPVAFSPDESSEIANIMSNIDTYIDEYSLSVIMNVRTSDDFDSFVNQVNQYGLERATTIYQAALDRYNLR